jgi:hypothetical protein
MARVPDTQTEAYAARRAVSDYDLPSQFRNYVYAWTTSEDEIDEAAIMVGIGGTSAEMVSAGLSYVEPMASITWCSRVTENGYFAASGEMGPLSVPRALGMAHRRCRLTGYDRVVILLQERGLWRDEWGILAPEEGLF